MFSRLFKKNNRENKRGFSFFGYYLVRKNNYEEAYELRLREFTLKAEVDKLKEKISLLELEIKNAKVQREIVSVKLGDPSPIDKEKRKMYVAQVAGLHKDILEPKLKQMISTAHSVLEEQTNDREFDQSMKGGIYMLWEILRWGQSMVNEQISIQMNESPSSQEEVIKK